MKLKTNKAISKRFKVTKNKKITMRAAGQDHFNAKERGRTRRNKRRDHQLAAVNVNNVRKFLPYS